MDAQKVLEEARLAGLQISVEDGNLVVTPSGLLTDSLREAIREHKLELVKALSVPAVPEARPWLEKNASGWDTTRGHCLGRSEAVPALGRHTPWCDML